MIYNTDLSKQYSNFRNGLNPVDIFFLDILKSNTLNKDILDIGCGDGKYLFYLSNLKPKSMRGIDVSPRMIEIAKSKITEENIEFVVGDATSLPYKDASFDTIFSVFTLHHIKDLAKFFSEIKRVLRPGGKFYATFNTFIILDPSLSHKNIKIRLFARGKEVIVENTIMSDSEFELAIKNSGLEINKYIDLENPVASIHNDNIIDISQVSKMNNIFTIIEKL